MNLSCALNNTVTPMKLFTLDLGIMVLANTFCVKCYRIPCVLTAELPCKLNKTTELNCLNNFGIDNNLYNITNCTTIAYVSGDSGIKGCPHHDIPGLCAMYKLYNNPNNIENFPDVNVTNSWIQTNTITPTNTVYITNQVLQSTPHFRFDNVTKTETATINTTKTFTETKTQNVTETQTQTKVCPNVTTKTPVLITLPKSTLNLTSTITATKTNYISKNTQAIDNLVNKLSDLNFQKCLNNNKTIDLVETTEIAKNIEQSFIDKIGLTYVIIGASFISACLLFTLILALKKVMADIEFIS